MRTTASALLCAFMSLTSIACQEQPTSLLDGDGGSSSNGNNGGNGDGGSPTTSDGGSSGDGGSEPIPQKADFEISASGPADLKDSRASTNVSLTIAPNGYMGVVSLSLTNVPADVDASVSPTSVTLDSSSDESVTLTVTTASNSQSGTFAMSVVGTVPEGQASGDVSVTIQPVITIIIPQNLESFAANPADTTAFGDYPTVIKAPANISAANPVTVKFFNDDTVSHEIHADQDDAGFGHGEGPIAAGAFDPVVREVNQTGEFPYYPHDIGTTILGLIVIE